MTEPICKTGERTLVPCKTREEKKTISVETDRGAAQVQKTVTQTKASLTMLLF